MVLHNGRGLAKVHGDLGGFIIDRSFRIILLPEMAFRNTVFDNTDFERKMERLP